ncbi:hypothetical protein HK096_009766, partial [Nowakowskiella sp. JEL0078]
NCQSTKVGDVEGDVEGDDVVELVTIELETETAQMLPPGNSQSPNNVEVEVGEDDVEVLEVVEVAAFVDVVVVVVFIVDAVVVVVVFVVDAVVVVVVFIVDAVVVVVVFVVEAVVEDRVPQFPNADWQPVPQ